MSKRNSNLRKDILNVDITDEPYNFNKLQDYIVDIIDVPTPGTPYDPPNIPLSKEIVFKKSFKLPLINSET